MASNKNINVASMLPTGTILHGNYRIDSYLSSGGFGNTYVATHVLFNETYAIKEFFMKDISERGNDSSSVKVSNAGKTEEFNGQLDKFRKEALRLRKLHNVHIVRVYDLFNENGTSYYVMDLIDGENLKERLQRTGEPMSEMEVRNVLDQVLDALQEVHGQGLWHMDLKPANVMVDQAGVVKLIDFGASKQFNSDTGGAVSTSAVAYTNGYAPREQMERSYDKFGPWTDFYALGAMLYNLLTLKHPPMPGDIDDDTSPDKHVALPMPAKVSPQMRGLVLWLIKTNRKQRPQNVQQIKEFLNPPAPNQTPPPVIDYDAKTLTLNVKGKGNVVVLLNGKEIRVPCTFPQQMQEMVYLITATAQDMGATRSKEVSMRVVVPALKQTPLPVVSYNPKTLTLNATGKGKIRVLLDGKEIQVPFTFRQLMQEQHYNVVATAQEDGEVMSDEMSLSLVIPALKQTPLPEISYDPKSLKLNVSGQGALQVFLDGKEIQVPYTFQRQPQEKVYNVTAIAQGKDELKSEEALLRVVVPALKQTAKPAISYDPKSLKLNVTGQGTLHVFLDGKEIQVPYTFQRQQQEKAYNVTATAQGKDEVKSEEARLRVVVPALKQTAKPAISYDAKSLKLNVTGQGTLHVLLDGKEIQVPYTFQRQQQEKAYNVTATAQGKDEVKSEEARLRVVVPALKQTAKPAISYDPKSLKLNVTGQGTLHVLLDGKEIQVPYTFKPQQQEMTYKVTATAQGKDEVKSEEAEMCVVVPAMVIPKPVEDTKIDAETKIDPVLHAEPKQKPVPKPDNKPYTVPSGTPMGPEQDEPKRNKLKVPIIAGAAGLLLVVGGYLLFGGGNSDDETEAQAGVEAVNPDSQEGTDESAPLPDTIYVEKLRVKIPAGECDYTGEVNRDSVPNGKGVAVFVANGDKVEAMFTDGNISDDNAVYTIARSKDVFKGSIKDKDFVQGTYIVADGSYFTGTFKGNVPYSGKWYNKNGSFYAEMKNGQMAR